MEGGGRRSKLEIKGSSAIGADSRDIYTDIPEGFSVVPLDCMRSPVRED